MNKQHKCSIKGCDYKAKWQIEGNNIINMDNRTYRICPKHKHLVINPLAWSMIPNE